MSRTDSADLLTADSPEGDEENVSQSEIYRELLDVLALTPLRVIWSDWRTRIGALIILAYVLMGTVGVVIVDTPTTFMASPLTGPFQDMSVPLGTNKVGEGILAKVIHATPAMLEMVAAGAVFSTILAAGVGTFAGYKGGTVDTVLMFFSDVAMTIPGLPLIILLTAIFQPDNPLVLGVILTINSWAGLARSIRSQVLSLRDRSYVEASRIMGIPTRSIITDDILPNIMPYVLVNFANAARAVIFGSVALYFIGVLPSSNENWGLMMNRAYTSGGALYTLDTAHWLIVPMIAVIGLSFGLILFVQGTERLFNPRIRARHAKTADDGPGGEEETTAGEMEGLSTW